MKLLLKEVLNLNKTHIDPIKPKELIADRYEIKDPIGSGAAGNIHVVYDTRTGEKFALKTLREGIYSKKELRRFIREANAMATLSHPNIVTIENLGWDKNRPFIVMEYVEGGNFKTILEKFHSGEINLNTLLFYFADICEGLRYLHERPNPIVHRDLKPQNILISNETTDDDGSVRNVLKITDFGLIHLDTESTILTSIGKPLGTFVYAPIPDQLERNKVDSRSDLYSLGVMLFEAITGKLPYKGDSDAAVLSKHLYSEPDFRNILPEIPARLITLTKKLLAKHPNDRCQRAEEVATELREIATPSAFRASFSRLFAAV